MTGSTIIQNRLSLDAYVSEESAQVGRPIWDLLRVGWEKGASTSLTEAEAAEEWEVVLARRFLVLAGKWEKECAHLSSVREMVLHPSYQQIIGMGPAALPFLFKELERRPDHWFWALRAITGENPILPEHRGDVRRMAQDWLTWARVKKLSR